MNYVDVESAAVVEEYLVVLSSAEESESVSTLSNEEIGELISYSLGLNMFSMLMRGMSFSIAKKRNAHWSEYSLALIFPGWYTTYHVGCFTMNEFLNRINWK